MPNGIAVRFRSGGAISSSDPTFIKPDHHAPRRLLEGAFLIAESEKQYGCHRCGNQDVRRRGRIEIESKSYFMSDQRGRPEFLGYEDTGAENVICDTFEPVSPGQFVCCECHHQFDRPKEFD